MSRYKPTAHSLPARIVLIGATIAIVGALFGTAAVADAVSTPAPKITEALQPGQTVSDIAPGGGDASFGGPTSGTPASGPASAPQPGQTGWSAARVGSIPATPAPRITEALQPGQTVSEVASGNGSVYFGAPTSRTPASGPASAPQPGQTGW